MQMTYTEGFTISQSKTFGIQMLFNLHNILCFLYSYLEIPIGNRYIIDSSRGYYIA